MNKQKLNKVLLVTTSRSTHASRLEEEINSLGASHLRLNTDDPKLKNLPQYRINQQSINYWINKEGKEIDLSQFQSVWWDEVVPNPEVYQNMPYGKWAFLETQKASDWILSNLEATYINEPIEIIRASNKLKQLKRARHLGLSVPETLVTSELRSLEKFVEEETIYKPISRPTEENSGRDFVIYTNVVDKREINSESIECKLSLFQRYVPKKYEIRAYVVGDKCLSAEIHSQKSELSKIDWRKYDIANTPYYTHQLPNEVSESLISLTKSFNLHYSAIDLIVTPKDEYVFLELNPQGMWLWVETLTGLPITKKLASLLSYPKTP